MEQFITQMGEFAIFIPFFRSQFDLWDNIVIYIYS